MTRSSLGVKGGGTGTGMVLGSVLGGEQRDPLSGASGNVLHCTVPELYCTELCCTVLHCAALYCTALYCSILY